MAQPTGTRARTRALMLMYHSVSESARTNQDIWTVHPGAFRDQIRLLANIGYSSVTVSELAEAWDSGSSLGRVVAITFDDGYRDLVEVAAPILDEFGFKASAYVCPALVGKDSGRLREGIHSDFATWSELMQLVDKGWEIGHHSMNHDDMANMSMASLRRDIEEGKRSIEQHLGVEVQSVAYPWGSFSNRTTEAVTGSGLKAGLAVSRHAIASQTSNRFAIPRVGIERNDSIAGFLLTIIVGYRLNGMLGAMLSRVRRVANSKARSQTTSPEAGQLIVPAVFSVVSAVQHLVAENTWLTGI